MSYFGEPWPSGVCEEGKQVETPVGAECFSCGTAIQPADRGSFMYAAKDDCEGWRVVLLPVHRECSLRDVLGGWGHLTDHYYWCRQRKDPDGGKSRRASALLVWEWVTTEEE